MACGGREGGRGRGGGREGGREGGRKSTFSCTVIVEYYIILTSSNQIT